MMSRSAPEPATLTTADPSMALDASALAGLHQLDPGGQSHLVERVLQTYLSSLSRLMDQMRDSLASGEVAALRVAVHTLKSSSASIGAKAFASHCASVEQALRRGDALNLSEHHVQLCAEADQVTAAVRAVLVGLNGSPAPQP